MKQIIVCVFIILIVGFSILLGCGLENPFKTEEETPVEIGPVVRLVLDGEVGQHQNLIYTYINFGVETDNLLDEHLLVYLEVRNYVEKDNFLADGKEHVLAETHRFLTIIEKGNKKSGLFTIFDTDQSENLLSKVIIRILPEEERRDKSVIHTHYQSGGETPNQTTNEIPEGYQFKPYRLGKPTRISIDLTKEYAKLDKQ